MLVRAEAKAEFAPRPKVGVYGTKPAKAGSILKQQASACFVSVATDFGSVVELTMPTCRFAEFAPRLEVGVYEDKAR